LPNNKTLRQRFFFILSWNTTCAI